MSSTVGAVSYGAPMPLEVKAIGDGDWEVTGYASVFGVRDLGDDVVERGAFKDTLRSGARVRFLYAHDAAKVLGRPLELREDAKGLHGRFKISKTSLGEDVRTLLKDGGLDSFSIGYVAKQWEHDPRAGVRRLTQLDLLEVSVVSLPMLPQARVSGVKAASPPSLVRPYAEKHLRLMEAAERRQRISSLRARLYPAGGGR